MRDCELCERPARMYCESDKAMLCWNCDERVHRANFLVEKHTRCLLCQVCQRLTPWKASGSKLCPTASVCISCAENHAKNDTPRNIIITGHHGHREESDAESHDDDNHVNEDDGEYDQDSHTDDDDDNYDEEQEGDNQVVPWSSPSPAVACTSSSSNGDSEATLKRMQYDGHLDSDDELDFHRPMKQPRLAEPRVEDESNSRQ